MNLLAIDCATSACSAALWLDDAPGPSRRAIMRRGHAEALMPMVDEVMAEARVDFSRLQAIAATVGPGAFTGIRIGLAAARGFALAAGLPVIGVTTLEAVAAAQDSGGHPLLVALDSKREDVYVQLFDEVGGTLGDATAIMPGEVGALLPAGKAVAAAGDAADVVLGALSSHVPALIRLAGPDLPDAAVVAGLAARRFADSPPSADAPPPGALYLRPPDAVPLAARTASAK